VIPLLCALFEIFAGFELGNRHVSFRDRLTPGLAGYQSGALPLFALDALVTPLDGSGLPGVADVGFFGSYARSIVKSRTLTADGSLAFEAQQISWEAGARYRVRIGGVERGGVSLGYGSLRSDFAGPSIAGVLLPSGTLQYWRPGLEVRVPLGPVVLFAGAGYLAPARQDAVGNAFPRSTSGGVDAALRGELSFGELTVRLALRYMRFFYSLHPLPRDPYIAGGALDEVASASLALGYRL
jgi:hypothetical protein